MTSLWRRGSYPGMRPITFHAGRRSQSMRYSRWAEGGGPSRPTASSSSRPSSPLTQNRGRSRGMVRNLRSPSRYTVESGSTKTTATAPR